MTLILNFLPWARVRVGLQTFVAFVVRIPARLVMAYKDESVLDHVLSALGPPIHSNPNYLLALMIVVFFGIRLGWLPITRLRGSYSPGVNPGLSLSFLGDALYHAALPMAVYVLTTIGSWMLIMKSSTLAALDEDYVTAARARGL